jgi:hypothetical protein
MDYCPCLVAKNLNVVLFKLLNRRDLLPYRHRIAAVQRGVPPGPFRVPDSDSDPDPDTENRRQPFQLRLPRLLGNEHNCNTAYRSPY